MSRVGCREGSRRPYQRQTGTEVLAQFVDIFTPPDNDERAKQSKWFELAPDPDEGHKDVFKSEVS